MSNTIKPPCQTINAWLKSNLGKGCLAPLTGTDARSLAAAVQIVDVYRYCRDPSVAQAFGAIVGVMQRSTQELAYHSIAHLMEWDDRARLWNEAGLTPFSQVRICDWEPGGAARPR